MGKEIHLIIPSAKLVPEELQHIGKLPGIIYPINQRIVFDYVYEQYNDVCSAIDIMCYEAAEDVERTLMPYLCDDVCIKRIPELGDLGQTIYFALKDDNLPVVINFADTIVLDDVLNMEGNMFYYAEDYMSDTWTYFRETQGVLTEVYDKISINSETQEKLFVGVFKIVNSKFFKACLEEAFITEGLNMSTFYYALCLYSQRYPMKAVKANKWFDIGHAGTYYNSKLEVRAREFNHISIDRDRGILRKTSINKEKFVGEISWYINLPDDVTYVRPRIFSYSTDFKEPYVSMEYYAYHTIHELFLYGDLNGHQWMDIFKRIRFVCQDFNRYQVCDDGMRTALEEMYLSKTLQRFEMMKKNEVFDKFFSQPICVNGKLYISLEELSEMLKNEIPKMLYDVQQFSIIHGDLCFSNIMVDNNFSFIKLIDPRGQFGSYDIYGDTRYELAKLLHSVDGKYDYIIKDLFSINYDIDEVTIDFGIIEKNRDFDIYKIFKDIFKDEIGNELNKIEFIEALLFLSMIPLHNESIRHQFAMLGTGIEILNRVIDITAK